MIDICPQWLDVFLERALSGESLTISGLIFEEVFLNFNPLAVAYLSDERLEEIATYKSIIRHPKKILATRTNAAYIIEKEHEYGSYANYIASWPSDKSR